MGATASFSDRLCEGRGKSDSIPIAGAVMENPYPWLTEVVETTAEVITEGLHGEPDGAAEVAARAIISPIFVGPAVYVTFQVESTANFFGALSAGDLHALHPLMGKKILDPNPPRFESHTPDQIEPGDEDSVLDDWCRQQREARAKREAERSVTTAVDTDCDDPVVNPAAMKGKEGNVDCGEERPQPDPGELEEDPCRPPGEAGVIHCEPDIGTHGGPTGGSRPLPDVAPEIRTLLEKACDPRVCDPHPGFVRKSGFRRMV